MTASIHIMLMLAIEIHAILLVILLFTSIINFPFIDAGKGIRVIGSMRGNEGNLLILVQNASTNDLYSLTIESFSGNIQSFSAPEGWTVSAADPDRQFYKTSPRIAQFKTSDMPVKSHESIRFNIKILPNEELKLKFEWTGYDSNGNEIAKGTFVTTNRLMKIEVTKIEITKDEAITIVKNWILANEPRERQGDVVASFAFLKYSGTIKGYPYFVLYQADPNSTSVAEEGRNVLFDDTLYDSPYGDYLLNKYISKNKVDRFAWVVYFYEAPPASSNRHYFVDANSGEVIGYWTPCPTCTCHHGNKTK